MPGIPWGTKKIKGFPNQRLAYAEPPKTITYYDICRKQNNIKVKYWPKDTPENCKLFPAFCPTIKPEIKPRCEVINYPLDFVYETAYQGYNFRKYSSDDDLVSKVRTGKGDEKTLYKNLGKVLYVEFMMGGT